AAVMSSCSTNLRLCYFLLGMVYITQMSVAVRDDGLSVMADSPPGCHGGDDSPPDPGNIFVVPGACAYVLSGTNANGDPVTSTGIYLESNSPGVHDKMTIQLTVDGENTYLEANGSASRMFSHRGIELVWKPTPINRVFRDRGGEFFLIELPSSVSGEVYGEKASTSSCKIYGTATTSSVEFYASQDGENEEGEVIFAA
ncbi:hypothetical protein FOZ62_014198, partial [Perkinsus olseni]